MQIRKEYEQLALMAMDRYSDLWQLREHPCRIAFLGSDKEKKSRGMLVKGECVKFAKKYAWLGDFDFMIIVYEPNCAGMDDDQMLTLIRHELNHIGVEVQEDGTAKYSIRQHDIQDFRCIVDERGLDWARV